MTQGSETTIVSALEAAIATERRCGAALWAPRPTNSVDGDASPAAGDRSVWLGGDIEAARDALAECSEVAAQGRRAAAFVSASALADARDALMALVEHKRPIVVHVVVCPRGRPPSPASYAALHSVVDTGCGVLVARHGQDASDLALIAHRAAEDAEAPILVVHDGFPASYALERVALPDAPLVRAILEPAPQPLAPAVDAELPPHRRAAARVPFALASAMRAFDRLSGRKLDAIEAVHCADADLALVAAGAIAETLRALVVRLRKDNPPFSTGAVGVVEILALRPFPGPQLVKALARTSAVAVVERLDAPMSQSSPLAVEVKAAFADALTWTPGYPGIGRIPVLFSGSIDPTEEEATPAELMAVVENALMGEQGRRVFHIGDGHPHPIGLAPGRDRAIHPDGTFAIRLRGEGAALLHVVSDLYGAHVRATPRPSTGAPDAHDVVVSPEPIVSHHGASTIDVVALDASDGAYAGAFAFVSELEDGGLAVVFGGEGDVENAWGRLPAEVRGALRARRARVFVAPSTGARGTTPLDAAFLGGLLRGRPPRDFDRGQLTVELERSLRLLAGQGASGAHAVAERVARAVEETREVPRPIIEVG